MSITSLVPANTQKARTTGLSAFERMLKAENVSMDVVQACILGDSSGKRLASVMDRFAYYLATREGKKGKLAPNTAISYFRNVKLWFFDEHPQLRVPTELILLKQGKTLEKHCLKRDNGGFTNKAPPCTKPDLRSLIRYVYKTALVASDYEDAALACLMWHCFGRSSDLGYISKQHVTMSADNVFYIRMLRMKTAEEQGLTLVPDRDDFLTCPLHALAVALAMQESPCQSLLSQLPSLASPAPISLDAGEPLVELLQARVQATSTVDPGQAPVATAASSAANPPRGDDGIQAYVNLFLKRVAEPAGAPSTLTSHSFRRGGAQHANGDERLAAQWIFDRGSWDMTRTNKGFAYVFNTPREDRKVARVLSGWDADDSPVVADIAEFDHGALERVARLQELLFASCTGLKDTKLNVSLKVLGVLTAYLIKYFPQVKTLEPKSLFVTRFEECMDTAGVSVADMLAWSSALNEAPLKPSQTNELTQQKSGCCGSECHHAAVITELIESNRLLASRLLVLETAVLKRPAFQAPTEEAQHQEALSIQAPPLKRRKKAATNLSAVWFEWYTRQPRVWLSSDRQKKSESRLVVAYMKLFLDDGFQLREGASGFKDSVLEIGKCAESVVLAYLGGKGIKAKSGGGVLREMRKLHRLGALDDRILSYRRLLAVEKIVDPAPVETQNILQLAGHV